LKSVGQTGSERSDFAAAQEKLPTDKVDEYQRIRARLDSLSKKEQMLLVEFTEESTPVKGVREQIAETEKLKMDLEEQTPALATLDLRASRTSGSPNAPVVDPAVEKARLIVLESKMKTLNSQLDQVRAEVANMAQLESELTDLQAKKATEEANYRSFSARLEQSRIDESLGIDRITNVSKIELPSPPFRDRSKSTRTTVMLALGGVAIGLAWAFLTEFYLDSSVRHPKEIETKLQLPLFVSIPDLNGRKHRRATGLVGGQTQREVEKLRLAIKSHEQLEGKDAATRRSAVSSETAGSKEIGLWDGRHVLRPYFETLRDRLVFDFEARNLTDKPKLIAVTGADRGSGVTTVAAGLASCLAETADGNVLLVDMHPDQDAARQFHKGKSACSLDEALESETRSGALVQGRLYVVGEGSNGDRLSRISPKRFADLLPKLKASGYDYIVFDMPPVNQNSVTPRLAGVMDITVFVIESERTDREIVRQASALLAGSKANVCAVLNKIRTYAPPRQHQEFPSTPQAGPIRRYNPAPVKPFAGSNG
jgi:Mrp family chromosome partitioning ATPase